MKPSVRAFLTCTLLPFFFGACSNKQEGYEIRSGKVMWNSWRGDGLNGTWSEGVVTEDANGFEILQQKTGDMNGYAKNTQNVFYGPNPLDGADAKTFTLLDDAGMARDARRVYDWGAVIKGADPETFQRTTLAYVGRDKNDYYYQGEPLHVRDMASFKILQDAAACARDMKHCIWARDKFDYYVDKQARPIADSNGFQVVQSVYAKDAKQVYYGGSVLSGADAATFQGLGDATGEFTKDARRVYWRGEPVEGWDAATIQLLDFSYAKDRQHAYFRYESGSPPLALPGADAQTFEVIGPSSKGFGYARDAKQVYYGAEVIPGADPATFVVDAQDTEKASDKHRPYHYGRPGN
jgi:DKNYY family